jgi:hypothetical protein
MTTSFWYDTDLAENDASNNISWPPERAYLAVYLATLHEYTDLLLYDTNRTENDAQNNSSTFACIRCRGNVFTEPGNDKHTDTETDARDLWSTPLRWAQMSRYTYQVS